MRRNRLVWGIAAIFFFSVAAVAFQSWTGVAAGPPVGTSVTEPSPGLLVFEQNLGQTDSSVEYLARADVSTLFLTPREFLLNLCRADEDGEPATCEVVRVSLVGASPNPEVSGLEPLPGVSNYLIGNDPAAWHTDIPHFARVRYEQVYPGIDLVFYGRAGNLEYDFIVAPGTDPDVIQVEFSGAGSLSLDETGNLVVSTAGGELVQHTPIVFQESAEGRAEVAGAYVLSDDGHVGFEIGPYDPDLPLTIDPVLGFSTYLGGSGTDTGNDVALDADGNIYVVGRTESADFPTGNAFGDALSGTSDVFLTKLSPGGESLLFSTYLGGSDYEFGEGVGVDRSGNIFVVGDTGSTDFPTYIAIQKTKNGAGRDCFVMKLDPAGDKILYSTYLGGSQFDYSSSIAVRPSGEVYVLGHTYSTNFPTWSPLFGTKSGGRDLFITSLPPSGLYLYYSTYLGGSGNEDAGNIAVDGSGNAYVTGYTESTDFSTNNANQPDYGGGSLDGVVARLHTLALFLDYSTYLGGSESDFAWDVWVDRDQNAYVVSETYSADFPTKDAYQPESAGSTDAVVTRLAADGSIDFSTFLGGSSSDEGKAIVVDPFGYIYLAGTTSSSDFPTARPFQGQRKGTKDVFTARLSPRARALTDSTYLGGTVNVNVWGLAVDSRGVSYVAGSTNSVDFPTLGAIQPTHGGGNWDGFVFSVTTPLDFFITATPQVRALVSEDRTP